MSISAWKPLRSRPTNTHMVSGLYGPSATDAYIDGTLTAFTKYIPSSLVDTLIERTIVLICDGSEFASITGSARGGVGQTSKTRPDSSSIWGVQNQVYVQSGTSASGDVLTMIHEWGHRVDHQWIHARAGDNTIPSYSSIQGARSGMADFEALWQRVLQLKPTYTTLNLYGWTNQSELFAELFMFYWAGHGPGVTGTGIGLYDQYIRELTTGSQTGSDSWTTYVFNLMANLSVPTIPAQYL